MPRSYKVLTDRMAGHKKGDVVPGPFHPALIGVHLEDVTEPLRLKCPACANEPGSTAKAKKATYSTLEELAEHYADEHPALAAPTEVPEEEVKVSG